MFKCVAAFLLLSTGAHAPVRIQQKHFHKFSNTHTHTHTQCIICIYTYVHTNTHTHTQTHTHTHTHTHTQTLFCHIKNFISTMNVTVGLQSSSAQLLGIFCQQSVRAIHRLSFIPQKLFTPLTNLIHLSLHDNWTPWSRKRQIHLCWYTEGIHLSDRCHYFFNLLLCVGVVCKILLVLCYNKPELW